MAVEKNHYQIILGEAWALFNRRQADYGAVNAYVLGEKGQFADIWRKIGKLKRALWDDVELTGEQPREILMDLIGHCILTIDMIDRKREGKDEPY